MMLLLSFRFPQILLFLAMTAYASCKHAHLSKFGKKALDHLPKEDFNKLFGLNYKDEDDFARTVINASDVFAKVYGQPFPDCLREELDEVVKNVAVPLTPKLLFTVFANALSRTLEENGMLTKENVDELAKKYAKELKKAACSLESDAFSETEPAVVSANAQFLKSLGMPTEMKLVEFQENLLDEAKKDVD